MSNEELEYFQNKLNEAMGKGLPKKYLETTNLGDVDKDYENRLKERIEKHLIDIERIKKTIESYE
jgi:hypothetical protein